MCYVSAENFGIKPKIDSDFPFQYSFCSLPFQFHKKITGLLKHDRTNMYVTQERGLSL